MIFRPLSISILPLWLLGLIFLSILLVTILISQTVHRHILFTNLICTYILYSSVMIFSDVMSWAIVSSDFAPSTFGVIGTIIDSVRIIAITSNLSLIIHLWFAIRSAFHNVSPGVETLRTVLLLVTPYLMGMISFTELFKYRTATGTIFLPVFYAELSLVIIVSLWDVLVLITFFRNRRILQRANISGVLSISLLARLSVLCFLRLIFIGVFTAYLPVARFNRLDPSKKVITNASAILESLYPLLLFFLLGTQRDILHVWLPCFIAADHNVSEAAHDIGIDRENGGALQKPS